MRIAVVGLGGVGGYIGASLAKTSHDIVGFARGEHLLEIQEKGITIVEDEITWTQILNVQNLDNAEGYFDIVLFCVKSYDLEESYKKISSYIDKKTTILSFSNGVVNGDILRNLSESIVLDACVYILSHKERAGVIRKKGKVFATIFGGDREATVKLQTIFEKANLRTKTPKDIQTAIWKKYIFISAFATLTTYYDKSISDIYKYHRDEAKELLNEINLVAQAKGIDISSEIEKALVTASKVPIKSFTSMYLDFKNGSKNELESLSGYIVREALLKNIKVPLMEKMYKELL